jgi:hypothetical protein
MTRTLPPPGASTARAPGAGTSSLDGSDQGSRRILALSVLGAAACGSFAAVFGTHAAFYLLGGIVAIALLVVAALYPFFATAVYVITMPILSGIDRGTLIPLLRPNEALLVVLVAGACIGAFLRYLRGDDIRPKFYAMVDVPLAVFVLLATIWPMASLTIRGVFPTGAEWAGILPIVKLAGLYFLVRYTVTTELQTMRMIRLIVWPGATVALIAVLQTLKFGPVLNLIETVYGGSDTGGDTLSELSERGSATLGSPIAAGDVITICLILVFCCGARGLLGRRERLVLALVLGTGVLAAGQFTTWIEALLAFGLLFWRFPQLRQQATRFAPLAGVAMVVGAPAFLGRLDSVGEYGPPVPESWLGRYDNLAHLFIPQFNWVTTFIGVSPNDVLTAPEEWRQVIYLESGVLDFVWVGGIPLLAASGCLRRVCLMFGNRLAVRTRSNTY